jgi:hypothetical protein
MAFVCDSLRMAAGGGIEPFDADQRLRKPDAGAPGTDKGKVSSEQEESAVKEGTPEKEQAPAEKK